MAGFGRNIAPYNIWTDESGNVWRDELRSLIGSKLESPSSKINQNSAELTIDFDEDTVLGTDEEYSNTRI